MARPKLPNNEKKESINLSVSKEVKEMANFIRVEGNISISELLENSIKKEYKKLQKKNAK